MSSPQMITMLGLAACATASPGAAMYNATTDTSNQTMLFISVLRFGVTGGSRRILLCPKRYEYRTLVQGRPAFTCGVIDLPAAPVEDAAQENGHAASRLRRNLLGHARARGAQAPR